MRIVDADAAKEIWNNDNQTAITMRRIFDGLPTVDASPVRHGKWIDRVDTDTDMHECSICGARVVKGLYEYDNPNNYCYHCGAKMDLEVMDNGQK